MSRPPPQNKFSPGRPGILPYPDSSASNTITITTVLFCRASLVAYKDT